MQTRYMELTAEEAEFIELWRKNAIQVDVNITPFEAAAIANRRRAYCANNWHTWRYEATKTKIRGECSHCGEVEEIAIGFNSTEMLKSQND